MGYQRYDPTVSTLNPPQWAPPTTREMVTHIMLVSATFITCLMAGTQWVGANPLEVGNWGMGLTYAILTMTFLLAHEYGHYVAAYRHGLRTSLPFVIPVPPTLMPFGTFGAVIRTKSPMMTKNQLFDVGVAGPLAGFVVCLSILAVGFATLPGPDYLYAIHPELLVSGQTASGLTFGDSILFDAMRQLATVFGGSSVFVPPMNEIYHYPFLCVGWFGLFVTSMNLLPFGQLDGGHVLYALIGKRQHLVGRILWWTLFTLSILWLVGLVHEMFSAPDFNPASYSSWVLWLRSSVDSAIGSFVDSFPWLFALGEVWSFWLILIRFVIRVEHPVLADEAPLSKGRMVLGWLAIVILILSFAPRAIYQVP